MPVDEQIKLAIECRGAALEGYYRGFESAKSGDKNDYFCHQVGILEAARSVLVPNKENRDNDQITRALQMETVPFNKPDAELAQRAFVEYLVWRFFPDQADVTPIQEVMRQFVGEIYETDVGDSDDKNFRYEALYSNKYDWQEFAVAAAKERIGHDNA